MVLRVSLTFGLPSLDVAAYKAAWREHIGVVVRQGLRAFIKATTPDWPVDTGMSLAAIQKVAETSVLGKQIGRAVPITALRTRPRTTGFPNGKSIAAGKMQTKINITDRGFRVVFSFRADITHFTFNRPGPDGKTRTDNGRAAFREEVRFQAKRKFPKIKRFIRTRSVST